MLRIIAIKKSFQKDFAKGSPAHSCSYMVHCHCNQLDIFKLINVNIYLYKVLCTPDVITIIAESVLPIPIKQTAI